MKGSRLYMILLFAFLMIVFLFEYMAPHKFVWNATYDKKDKEPFGSYVFDDVLSSSVQNYSVANKTFYQIIKEDSTISRHAFLITEDYPDFNKVDIESLYKLVHLGNKVMICTRHFPSLLKDTLCFGTAYGGYFPSLETYIQKQGINTRDSIFFGTDTLNPQHIYEVYPHFHPISIIAGRNRVIRNNAHTATVQTMKSSPVEEQPDSTDNIIADHEIADDEAIISEEEFEDEDEEWYDYDEWFDESELTEDIVEDTDSSATIREFVPVNCDSMEILVWDSENKPLVLRAFIGKGEIFIVSTPLMFTNYGVLDGDNASYAFRLLSYLKDNPLIRIEAYGKHDDEPQTPLRYLLSEPPLRWAVYSTMILLLLFMFFTTKRRQRIIPVVNAPPNRSLGFMQLISNLYYQKHNNAEILIMKHTYFCAEVKRLIGVDLQENIPNEQDNKRLVEKTGLEADDIRGLLKNIQMTLYRSEADDIQLKQYIDGMNDILRALMN